MKNKSILYFLCFPALTLILILAGCSKSNTLVKILGTWERVNVVHVNDLLKDEWLFDVDDIISIYHVQYDSIDPTVVKSRTKYMSGKYQIKIKLFKKFITMSGFSEDALNDDWEIVKSNKNTLMIVSDKQGGLLIYEFVKKEY